MEIKYYFLGVALGSGFGTLMGLLGGMIGGAIGSTQDPLLKILEFDSYSDKLRIIWSGAKSLIILKVLIGFSSGLYVSVIEQLAKIDPIGPTRFRFIALVVFVLSVHKLIDHVNKAGESIFGEPGGIIGSATLGAIGGFIGIYTALPYIVASVEASRLLSH